MIPAIFRNITDLGESSAGQDLPYSKSHLFSFVTSSDVIESNINLFGEDFVPYYMEKNPIIPQYILAWLCKPHFC